MVLSWQEYLRTGSPNIRRTVRNQYHLVNTNSGGDAAATSAGLSWLTLTTSWWGNTDSGTVDRGRHYTAP